MTPCGKEAGSALFDVLNSNAKGLPQPEANFNIIQIAPENFTRTIRMARNVITPDISNIYSLQVHGRHRQVCHRPGDHDNPVA